MGLGIIGQRVVDNLRRRQFRVFVWNRTPKPVPNFVGTPREVGELCDVIQIFVSDDDALRSCLRQIAPALTSHHVVLAHSTVAPETMREGAEVVHRRGARFLDAPFTGSKLAAQNGELIYYIGGDEGALRDVSHVLQASSKEIVPVGRVGDASTIKIATNIITAVSVQAAIEGLSLVTGAGMAPEVFLRALESNASNSGTLSLKLPKVIAGDFEPHFSIKHMLKDLRLAERLARVSDQKLDLTAKAEEALAEEAKRGFANDDYAAIARRLFPEGMPVPATEPEALTEAELPFGAEEAKPEESAPPPGAPEPDRPAEEESPASAGALPGANEEEAQPLPVLELPEPEQNPDASAPPAPETLETVPPEENFFSRFLKRRPRG